MITAPYENVNSKFDLTFAYLVSRFKLSAGEILIMESAFFAGTNRYPIS